MATKFRAHRKAGMADKPAPAIADVPTGINAMAADNAAAINKILAALRDHGVVAK